MWAGREPRRGSRVDNCGVLGMGGGGVCTISEPDAEVLIDSQLARRELGGQLAAASP